MIKFIKYTLIMALLALGCQSTKNAEKVREFVINEVKKNPNGTLDFNKFNSFNWNKLYIIMPYTIENLLDKTLLKYKNKIQQTDIEERDDIAIILLFNNEELVSMNVFKLVEGNFTGVGKINHENKINFYKRNEAIFDYTTSKKGYTNFKSHN